MAWKKEKSKEDESLLDLDDGWINCDNQTPDSNRLVFVIADLNTNTVLGQYEKKLEIFTLSFDPKLGWSRESTGQRFFKVICWKEITPKMKTILNM